MNIYQKTIITALIIYLGLSFTSCLKYDLPEYENWDKNSIDNVYVEYRYEGDKVYNGKPVVEYIRLNVNRNIDEDNGVINMDITVPSASGSFTEEIRAKVMQSHLWMYIDISTAAKVVPVGDSPKLGTAADLTKPHKYKVIAANGDEKVWTIEVKSFNK